MLKCDNASIITSLILNKMNVIKVDSKFAGILYILAF